MFQRVWREADVRLVDDENRIGSRRRDRHQIVRVQVCAGRIVRVGDDHHATARQGGVDLLDRRDLLGGDAEAAAGKHLQVVGVGGQRNPHPAMLQFTTHRPDELACTATGDHRAVTNVGDPAVEIDHLIGGVVGMQHDVRRLHATDGRDRRGRRAVTVDAGAQVHVDPATGVAALRSEVDRSGGFGDQRGHGAPRHQGVGACRR
jgi:hypothetical protein